MNTNHKLIKNLTDRDIPITFKNGGFCFYGTREVFIADVPQMKRNCKYENISNTELQKQIEVASKRKNKLLNNNKIQLWIYCDKFELYISDIQMQKVTDLKSGKSNYTLNGYPITEKLYIEISKVF